MAKFSTPPFPNVGLFASREFLTVGGPRGRANIDIRGTAAEILPPFLTLADGRDLEAEEKLLLVSNILYGGDKEGSCRS